MRIQKAESPDFDEYEVLLESVELKVYKFWRIPYRRETITRWLREPGVIEADDSNGLLVCQVFDKNGYPVYTNGPDDIVIENAIQFFLLMPAVAETFLKAGFKPKITTQYVDPKFMRIVNKKAVIEDVQR